MTAKNIDRPSIKDTIIEIDYTNTPISIGGWSYGPSLLQIHHGIEDYALVCFLGESARWFKIQYTQSGRSFIKSYNIRYYFDECLRF